MKKSFLFTVPLGMMLAAPLAHADNMKPGLWEFSTQMNGGGMAAMPAIPEAQRKQMESMGIKLNVGSGGVNVTTRTCITPEQAKQGVPPSMDRNGIKCEATDVRTSGKTTTWKMACTGQYKATGQGTVTYDSDEHFHGDTTINAEQGPVGPMTMNSKFDAKFLTADCKGAK